MGIVLDDAEVEFVGVDGWGEGGGVDGGVEGGVEEAEKREATVDEG